MSKNRDHDNKQGRPTSDLAPKHEDEDDRHVVAAKVKCVLGVIGLVALLACLEVSLPVVLTALAGVLTATAAILRAFRDRP